MTAERHLFGRAGPPSSASILLVMAFLIFVWSLNYIVAKIGLRELPALALGSFRLVTAGIVSLPVLFFSRTGKGQVVKVTVEVQPTGRRCSASFGRSLTSASSASFSIRAASR